MRSPHNSTPSVCREFTRKYQGHVSGLFIYGDPAGRHEDTRSEKGFNDFTIILKELSAFHPTLRVQASAPSVVMRGNFINTIFEKGFEGIQILIGHKCRESISDLINLKEAGDGTKLKKKVMDPKTGVSYEKWGHCSDSLDYLITTLFSSEYQKYVNGGKLHPILSGKNISKNTY